MKKKIPVKFHAFFTSLNAEEKKEFAKRCSSSGHKVTVNHLMQIAHGHQLAGQTMMATIWRALGCHNLLSLAKDLRPDLY